MMYKNIFFTFFPKVYLVFLAFGISLIWYQHGQEDIGKVIVFVILLLVFYKIGIVIHELGHLLAAYMVNLTPKRFILGRGHEVLRFNRSGVMYQLNSNLNSGIVLSVYKNLDFYKIKNVIYAFGGPGINLIITAIILFFYGFKFPEYLIDVSIWHLFALSNFILAVINLIPISSNSLIGETSSDGLSIIQVIFNKRPKDLGAINEYIQLLDAQELLATNKFKEALELYNLHLAKYKNDAIFNLNRSIAYFNLKEIDTAIEILEENKSIITEIENDLQKALFYNALAWFHLINDESTKANEYSQLAINLSSENTYIKGTRSQVLLSLGNYKDVESIVKSNFNKDYTNSATLSAATCLYEVNYYKKHFNNSKMYLTFIEKNKEHMTFDIEILFEQAKCRVNQFDNNK